MLECVPYVFHKWIENPFWLNEIILLIWLIKIYGTEIKFLHKSRYIFSRNIFFILKELYSDQKQLKQLHYYLHSQYIGVFLGWLFMFRKCKYSFGDIFVNYSVEIFVIIADPILLMVH